MVANLIIKITTHSVNFGQYNESPFSTFIILLMFLLVSHDDNEYQQMTL